MACSDIKIGCIWKWGIPGAWYGAKAPGGGVAMAGGPPGGAPYNPADGDAP